MARPITLRRPPLGGRYDPESLDAHGRAAGDLLNVVDDGSGGKRSAWATADDVTGGASSGRSGNWSHAFVTESGDSYVLGAHETAAEVLDTGMYRRFLRPGSYLRGQATVLVAGSLTSYLDIEYSLDDGDTWETDAIGIRVPMKIAKHAVGFAVLVPEAAEGDVLLRAVCVAGNASAVPELRNFIIESTSVDPGEVDGEDGPVDTDDPTDYPEGGPLGVKIWRVHAGVIGGIGVANPANGATVPTWSELIGFLPGDVDAKTVGGDGQGAPTFDQSAFSGLGAVSYDGVNDGHTVTSQFTADSRTIYLLDSNIGTPAGDYGALMNGNVFPWGLGILLEASGEFGFYYNSSSGFNAYTAITTDWDRALPHVYTLVCDRTATPLPKASFYVDGVLKGSVSDSNLAHLTEATAMKWGAYTGVSPVALKRAEGIVWNAAHSGATVASNSAAIRAAWGL